MNEKDLLDLWAKARLHIILSQLAPTFLLTICVVLVSVHGGFGHGVAGRIAVAGILLAAGILGFVAQYTSASEASAIAADLRQLEKPSFVARRIVASARWTVIVKFVTPAVFVVIYLALLWELFVTPHG